MNKLTVNIDLEDDDGTAGLTGRLEANGFSGSGEGWFNISEIKMFCNAFKKVLSDLEGTAELVAGQSKADCSEFLERFGLRCYVISKTGIFGVHVTLTDYPYTDCRQEEISKVSGELKINSQFALNFISQLSRLTEGNIEEAELIGID
jgi:hypothetical protein